MKKIIVFSALLAASGAWAEAPRTGQRNDATLDPNEQICQNIEDTGSRLSRSRICRTRAEWAEQRRAQREIIERNQQSRVSPQ